jgi:hypothetical protein
MERTFENVNCSTGKKVASTLHDATESLLANLPILILGTVIALAVAGELFI